MKTLRTLLLLSIIAVGTLVAAPSSVHAASGFDPGRIIDDSVFTNNGTMTLSNITDFINAKGAYCVDGEAPCLKNFTENGLSSAQIIYNAAQTYTINPQALIATLQKETGLLTITQPGAWRYRTAMGYGCPDTAACDAQYYGFTNQMNRAASMFHRIITRDPTWYSPYVVGQNFVYYSPTLSCGGTNVNITNWATAALYDYTPYQPNAASLAAGYGTGDACSSYGNRNFFNYFTDWFGSTYNGLTYVQVSGGSGQYLLYEGKKQALTYDALFAWNIYKLPLMTRTQAELNTIADVQGGPLTAQSTVLGTSSRVFADAGTYYDINDALATTWGNFKNSSMSYVGWTVLKNMQFGHTLPVVAMLQNDPHQYLMEGGVLYPIDSPTVVRAWNGTSSILLSSNYAQGLMVSPQSVSSNLATTGSTTYLIDGTKAYPVSASIAPILEGIPHQTLSSSSLGRYELQSALPLLTQSTDGKVYIFSDNQKHYVSSYPAYLAYQSNVTSGLVTLSNDALSLIPSGSSFSSAFFRQSSTGTFYYVGTDGIHVINSSLASEFGGLVSNAQTVGASFINAYPASNQMTQFIQAPGQSVVYFVSQGNKIPINRYDTLVLLNGQNAITKINSDDFQVLPTNTIPMSPVLTVGSSGIYGVSDKQNFFTTSDPSLLATWKLTTSTQVSQATFDRIKTSTSQQLPLSLHIQMTNGYFCNVDMKTYCADKFNMIYVWDLLNGVIHPSNDLLGYAGITQDGALSLFVSSPIGTKYANNVFAMIDGKYYYVTSPDILTNLGFTGSLTRVSASTIDAAMGTYALNGYLFKDSGGSTWVIDGTSRRLIPSSYISNWTSTSIAPLSTSTYFTGLYTQGSDLSRAITGPGPGIIYGMDGGVKRGITTYQKYTQNWSPYVVTSNALINILPTGPTY